MWVWPATYISDIKGEEELRVFYVGTGSTLLVHREKVRFMCGLWMVVSSWAYCILGSCYRGRLSTCNWLLCCAQVLPLLIQGWETSGREIVILLKPHSILLHTSTLQSVPSSGWNAPGRWVVGLCTEAHTGLRHPSLWPAANQWANSHYRTQVSAVCWDIWYGDRGLVSA